MQDDFLITVEAFRARHSLSKNAFGVTFAGNGGLLAKIDAGRKLRATTMKKIMQRMDAYNEGTRKIDLARIEVIRRCGFVSVETDGTPRLESDTQIEPEVFRRLVADGVLVPSGDALFGVASQTYRLADA
jgi:hypothetical protein